MKLNTKQNVLVDLIREHSSAILDDPDYELNKTALLCAIAVCESSLGKFNRPRHEAIYDVGGKYYKRSKTVKRLVEKYGPEAACSWSSFQIMYITAYEMGYTGKPSDLQDDCVALPFVITFINKRIISKDPSSVKDIFDAYNSGNFKDKFIPEDYINKGLRYYAEFCVMFPLEKKAAPKEQPITLDSNENVDSIKQSVKDDISIFKDNPEGITAKPKSTLWEKILNIWKDCFGNNKHNDR